MKKIVIINGSGGVGKDTFCDLCSEYAEIMVYSSVDEIKAAAKMLGWNGGKEERDRKFLSDLKVLSSQYNNYPYQCTQNAIDYFKHESDAEILFIHIREPLDIAQLVQENPDIRTVLVTNKHVHPINTNMADANVLQYDYDYYIQNDAGLNELDILAKWFVSVLAYEDQ